MTLRQRIVELRNFFVKWGLPAPPEGCSPIEKVAWLSAKSDREDIVWRLNEALAETEGEVMVVHHHWYATPPTIVLGDPK